ncbi:hypothetical protein CRG98_010314 [Punica granatum]|uniref:Uncharacterized protein n=1 Tax=Punica granatum TaxID=22663 RepID=A0A2I0KM38_PUNGR|nr:hypothetical protein CRG98_010314 [Punica granatum]
MPQFVTATTSKGEEGEERRTDEEQPEESRRCTLQFPLESRGFRRRRRRIRGGGEDELMKKNNRKSRRGSEELGKKTTRAGSYSSDKNYCISPIDFAGLSDESAPTSTDEDDSPIDYDRMSDESAPTSSDDGDDSDFGSLVDFEFE